MTENLEHLMYLSGLTAQGCWDEMDMYDQEAVMKFADLIIAQCADVADKPHLPPGVGCGYITLTAGGRIKKHFAEQK